MVVKHAPFLFRLNGCGAGLYGHRDLDDETGTYVKTWFLCAQVAGGPKPFHMSAYWATSFRVTFSPPPPISESSPSPP